MKILHVDEQRGWRGGEQQASWLIQGLVRRGHWVAVAGRPGEPFVTNAHGGADVQRFTLPFRSEADLWSAWRLGRIVRAHAVDIVHAHSSHAHTFAGLARTFAGRGKVVVSRRVGFAPRKNAVNRWKYRLPDRFVSVSGEVDRVMRDFGLNDGRRTVVRSSVDLKRLQVAPIARAALNVPEDVPLLVTAGALVGHKDHANLLDAFARVRNTVPGVHLVIAGDGPLRAELERHAETWGLADAVRFLGHRDDAPSIIRTADIYVSSSWSEGLGTSVLEALGCETPVVATVAGGVPEMVIDGKTGSLVPSRDPEKLAGGIIACLENREQARAMAAEGRRLVEAQFGVDRMVEDTLSVYQQLLAGVNGP